MIVIRLAYAYDGLWFKLPRSLLELSRAIVDQKLHLEYFQSDVKNIEGICARKILSVYCTVIRTIAIECSFCTSYFLKAIQRLTRFNVAECKYNEYLSSS